MLFVPLRAWDARASLPPQNPVGNSGVTFTREIPLIAKLFVSVPDTKIWLTNPAPAGFLRWEGPIVLPTDPLIRVDLLSGTKERTGRVCGKLDASDHSSLHNLRAMQLASSSCKKRNFLQF